MPLLLAKAKSIRNFFFFWSHGFDSFSSTVCHLVLFLLTLKCLCCWHVCTIPFRVPGLSFIFLFFVTVFFLFLLPAAHGLNRKEDSLVQNLKD